MKMLFFFLIVPVFSIGQTIHIKDDKIVYEGSEKIEALAASPIIDRMYKILPVIVDKCRIEDRSSNSIKAAGEMRLQTPYNIIRIVRYTIKLKAGQEGYEYSIDDVSFTEKKRGEKAVTASSKEFFKKMSDAGKTVSDTEQILNETDMRFQKLLDLLRSEVNKS